VVALCRAHPTTTSNTPTSPAIRLARCNAAIGKNLPSHPVFSAPLT
jgi:hypothetical protein